MTQPSNGVAHHVVTLDQARDYYCRNCGRWLCSGTVPLGTPGAVRIRCDESACRQLNSVRIGSPPPARVDRARWLQLNQARRHKTPTQF